MKSGQENVYLAYNTQDPKIVFQMTFWGTEGDCYIFDFNNQLRHQFKITNIQTMDQFVYIGTIRLDYKLDDYLLNPNKEVCTYATTKHENNSWTQEQFKKPNHKKLIRTHSVTGLSNEEAPFLILLFQIDHHFLRCEPSLFTFKGVPQKVTISDGKNTTYTSLLTKQDLLELHLDVSSEIIKYLN